MKKLYYDLVIVGGGCAGMAAAIAANDSKIQNIALIDRSAKLGGVLRQCIHNGFGLNHFGKDLTGTEYAFLFASDVASRNIDVFTSSTVLDLAPASNTHTVSNEDSMSLHKMHISRKGELIVIYAHAVILATGCRERPRGSILLPGTRPAGVITAGTAQRYLNLEGYLVGRKIVILGSGDIGLIMARQFVLEGAQVLAVCEILPYSSGLTRNIVQCLDDFNIPLYFNTTVTEILGSTRVTGVKIAQVDNDRQPISETERTIPCDSLVLSVGLIPEKEIAVQAGIQIDSSTGSTIVDNNLQTEIPGIFSCGNGLHVHDLADFAALEGTRAGQNAAYYLQSLKNEKKIQNKFGTSKTSSANYSTGAAAFFPVHAGSGVCALVPQRLCSTQAKSIHLQFRPTAQYSNCTVVISCENRPIYRQKRDYLTPGEMCSVTLSGIEVTNAITVSVEVAT